MDRKPLYTTLENESNNIFVNFVMNMKISIRSKILVSFVVVMLLMGCLNVFLILGTLKYSRQYNSIVSNITTANSINGVLKRSIDSEMWDIVAGKKKFEEGNQYKILDEVSEKINNIMQDVTSAESKTKLVVILRTIDTLRRYVDIMGEQMEKGSSVDANLVVLENIRGVSELVEDNIQEFIIHEARQTEQVKSKIQSSLKRWVLTNVIGLCFALIFSIFAAWVISNSIYKPIKKLHDSTTSIAKESVNADFIEEKTDEIMGLDISFNIMINKIKELLEKNLKEHENLKKSELKTLQAQINPHFLYNTLDTIVWMAEGNKSENVIEIVRALSNFFRITLSKGMEWITIREEIEHIRSYLIIQQMRYRDILQYNIEVDQKILDNKILKLTLQPLVENALYHGIKNKRQGGTIIIRAGFLNEQNLIFEVIDDGIGMTEKKLMEIKSELNSDSIEPIIKDSGFGMNNVHKRVKLYYGDQYGLSIYSEYGKGTSVSLVIPVKKEVVENNSLHIVKENSRPRTDNNYINKYKTT